MVIAPIATSQSFMMNARIRESVCAWAACKNNSDEYAGFHGRQFIGPLACVSFYCGKNYRRWKFSRC